MIGQTISHYKVLEQIGGGGMGVVYRAEDTSLQRQVALKFLPPDIVNDRQAVERFKREARAASALNHPNICTIHEIGEHEGQPFIVMELMKGQTLKEKLARGPLKTDEVLELGIQLADALDAAHSEGIVHRDIKPANLFVTERGQAKILDFGLAKAARKKVESGADTETGTDPDMDLTKAGSTVGTVSYMSPEQALGEKVDARTDLFSLGVVLYEAVTGRQPFTGATSAAVFHQIISQAPTAPVQLNPDAPVELERVINKTLEKDPDLRCQTAAELRTDLKRLLRDTDSSRTVTVSAAGVTPAKPRRNVANWAIALAVLLAIVLAYVLFPTGAGEEASVRFSDLNPTFSQLTSQSGPELYPSLSPDGRLFVYASPAAGNWDIYARRVDGANITKLTGDSGEDDTQPAVSPDGEFIAFRSERGGGGIFVMGATGEGVTRLADVGFNPVWSPDGREVLYATQNVAPQPRPGGAQSDLWAVDVSTQLSRRILDGLALQPHWSPSGRRIAYWSFRSEPVGQRDIWTVAADGSDPIRVTNDPPYDWNPIWSPDGNYLYFASNRSGSMNLWRVPIDEETGATLGDAQAVTTAGGTGDSIHLSISADGKRLAYTIWDARENIVKAAFDPETKAVVGEPMFVTEGSLMARMPDVSPDGETVAFVRGMNSGKEDIYTVASGGGPLRAVTDDASNDRRPRWSPDGNRIGFDSNRSGIYQLSTINRDGSAMRQVTSEPTDVAGAFVWSPNGSRFAYYYPRAEDPSGRGAYIADSDQPWEEQRQKRCHLSTGRAMQFSVRGPGRQTESGWQVAVSICLREPPEPGGWESTCTPWNPSSTTN